MFVEDYEIYKSFKFNQLFRNQLMAAALLQNKKYGFVYTGLFCHQEDHKGVKIGEEFRKLMKDGNLFKVITYQKYIEEIQQLSLDWNQRELVMMLWARYCATQMSENILKKEAI